MRVLRRAKLRREAFTPAHQFQLLKGFVFLHRGYGRPEKGTFDEALAKADWLDHRDELLDYWTQNPATWTPDPTVEAHWLQARPGGPGSRPWAWWRFEAPEPRRPRETERAYLTRLSLLSPAEQAALADDEPDQDDEQDDDEDDE